MKLSLLPSLLLCLGLLQFSQGFSVRTPLQEKQSTKLANNNNYAATHKDDVSSRDAVITKAAEGESSEIAVEKKPSQLVPFLKGQKVVFWTSALVAISAAVTKKVTWESLRMNILAGTIIFMVGDWGAQLLTHYKTKRQGISMFRLDNNRFVISSILGVIWAGIANPAVYDMVERVLPGKGSVGRVLLKMSISISILSTAGNYVTMLFRRYVKQLWEDKPRKPFRFLKDCVGSCNHDFMEVLVDDLKIWPLYDIVCYSAIPPRVRPITNALMASAWSMYMSIASAKTTPEAELEEVKPINGDASAEETQRIIDDGEPMVTKATPSS